MERTGKKAVLSVLGDQAITQAQDTQPDRTFRKGLEPTVPVFIPEDSGGLSSPTGAEFQILRDLNVSQEALPMIQTAEVKGISIAGRAGAVVPNLISLRVDQMRDNDSLPVQMKNGIKASLGDLEKTARFAKGKLQQNAASLIPSPSFASAQIAVSLA